MIQASSLTNLPSKAQEDKPPMQLTNMLEGWIKHSSITAFLCVIKQMEYLLRFG